MHALNWNEELIPEISRLESFLPLVLVPQKTKHFQVAFAPKS